MLQKLISLAMRINWRQYQKRFEKKRIKWNAMIMEVNNSILKGGGKR